MPIIAELQKTGNVTSTFMRISNRLKCLFVVGITLTTISCVVEQAQTTNQSSNNSNVQKPPPKTIADRFAYPIGKTETITEAKDRKDDWYNAQSLGIVHRHALAGCAARHKYFHAVFYLPLDERFKTIVVNRAVFSKRCNQSRRASAHPINSHCHNLSFAGKFLDLI